MANYQFCKAQLQQAEQIVNLVNSAYRGEASRAGWTTEADLLDGLRTDMAEIQNLLADESNILLLCNLEDRILGSVHLQHVECAVEVGMFAVNPLRQGNGIGKQLLSQAEQVACQHWPIDRSRMSVLSCRHELLAFYQRRGYCPIDEFKPFPQNSALWTPKVENLQFVRLEKMLQL